MSFLSTVVRMPSMRTTFESTGDATLEQFVGAIVLPNITLREADEEMFEDNPIEYVRRDFEAGVGEFAIFEVQLEASLSEISSTSLLVLQKTTLVVRLPLPSLVL